MVVNAQLREIDMLRHGRVTPHRRCDHAGGVGSAIDLGANVRCIATKATGSPVAFSASTSAMVSTCRLIPNCTALESNV